MGNCFSVLRNHQSPRTPSTTTISPSRTSCGHCSTDGIDDEGEPLLSNQSVEEEQHRFNKSTLSGSLLPSENGQHLAEERQLSSDSDGQSVVGEAGENESLSDDKMHTPKSTRRGKSKKPPHISSAEKGRNFRNEFKTAAEGVRLKSHWEMEPPNLAVHVLFKYTHTNKSKTAAVLELRNREKLSRNHPSINRLTSARKALRGDGYHRVYAYLYVKEYAYVSNPLRVEAEKQDIKIVKKDEMSPDQLAIEIDNKLQLAPDPKAESTSNASPTNNLEDTDSASVPETRDDEWTAPKLKDLQKELSHVVSEWEDIGIQLNVSDGQLKQIKSDNPGNSKACLREMLRVWLSRVDPPPSWLAMADALETLDHENIAASLRSDYC